jgi:hypothetical protein
MNASKLLSVFLVPLCVGTAALAGESGSTSESSAGAAAAPLSRAEVLADLQVWRESGLAELSGGEEPAIFKPGYDACLARYLALRASPAFASLVQRIAQDRGEELLIAGTE